MMTDKYTNCDKVEHELLIHLFTTYAHAIAQFPNAFLDFPPSCQADKLLGLCGEAINNARKYPFDKMNRWLGFVQGVLIAADVLDVDDERNYTRPLFHELYERVVDSF